MGCGIGWIGHTVIQSNTQKQADTSLFEKKIKCDELGKERKKEVFLVDKVLYSKKLDTCIVGEFIYGG